MATSSFSSSARIPVGISSCLLGEPVRFNGSHKRSRFCTDILSNYFDFVSLCPEVAIGLKTPRQPIRLVSRNASDTDVQVLGCDDPSINVTIPLKEYAQQKATELQQLCGYIFMQKSPSCGLFGVKRYLANGHPEGTTGGVYATELQRLLPLVPMEEAGRLNDDVLRENFMVRVFTLHDWRQFRQHPLTAHSLIGFHARYKYLVMSHSLSHYKSMGRLLANLKTGDLENIADQYILELMTALAKPANRKLHSNTLMHLQGYLKQHLNPGDREELTAIIHQYRQGIVPLIVPMTLLKHHLDHNADSSHYARQQVYLNPHPYELGLRNAI
jgi:uncharacterized protein YbgA (DUF1722 family)/uncharacterized protein YbbK (DUF523 family)